MRRPGDIKIGSTMLLTCYAGPLRHTLNLLVCSCWTPPPRLPLALRVRRRHRAQVAMSVTLPVRLALLLTSACWQTAAARPPREPCPPRALRHRAARFQGGAGGSAARQDGAAELDACNALDAGSCASAAGVALALCGLCEEAAGLRSCKLRIYLSPP